MNRYSVIVPVYNSEHTLNSLYERVKAVFEETLQAPFELILVDDSSRDGSFALMQQLHEKDPRVRIVQLARNYGQPSAVLCGFAHAGGDFIITMDDDLQHPPEEIPKLVQRLLDDPEVDVVLGKYVGRQHNWIRRTGTRVARWATTRMMGTPPDLEMTSFRCMRRFVMEAVLQLDIYHPQIGDMLLHSSNRIVNVPVHHDARAYGHSGYTFRRLAKDLFYDISTHSAFPMTCVRNIGLAGVLASLIFGLVTFIRFLVHGNTVEGWTSLILVVLLGFSIVLISMGVMGTYLVNILNEAKKLPHYVVRREDAADILPENGDASGR